MRRSAAQIVTRPRNLLGDVHLRAAHDPPEGAPVLQLRVTTAFGDVDIHPVPVTTAVV